MDKELLTKQLQDFAGKLINLLNSGIDQMPGFVDDFIKYNLYSNLFWMILSGILLIGIGIFVYKISKKHIEYHPEMIAITSILSLLPIIMLLILFFCSLNDFMKVLIAPKVFLLEYLKHLI